MAIQITIVGLGEIGTSLGLALKYQKNEIVRVGCDIHKYAEQNALSAGAVDTIQHNLFEATANADIIFFAVPAGELEGSLKLIGQDLKPGAVVLEISGAKTAAQSWAKRYLKDPTHFAGLYAALNPEWINEFPNEHHTAHEDLFQKGTFFIAALPETDPGVVKLASDLATLVGAHSAFCEAEELDGMIASVENLPFLLGNALFDAATRQPSWKEARKFGGKTFSRLSETVKLGAQDEKAGLPLLENRDNTLRMLNEFILTLKDYRDAIQNGDASTLETLLKNNQSTREKWEKEYSDAVWRRESETQVERPSTGEYFGQLFLGGLVKKKKN